MHTNPLADSLFIQFAHFHENEQMHASNMRIFIKMRKYMHFHENILDYCIIWYKYLKGTAFHQILIELQYLLNELGYMF